jgi:hypothetical protein
LLPPAPQDDASRVNAHVACLEAVTVAPSASETRVTH